MANTKKSSYVAPVVVTVLLVVYFLFLMGICFIPFFPIGVKIGAAVIFLPLIGVSVFVLRERMKELRSGELDDLSKY